MEYHPVDLGRRIHARGAGFKRHDDDIQKEVQRSTDQLSRTWFAKPFLQDFYFSMVLLRRIVPYIEPELSDMQAGFRKGRGCRDNILILTMAINHLLKNVESKNQTAGIITYIDFVAAFDSIKHSYTRH